MAQAVRRRWWLTVAALSPFLLAGFAAGAPEAPTPVIGVKIYECAGSFSELCREWRSLGINTAFVSATLASDKSFREAAGQNGVGTFIIYPVFYNPEALDRRPDLAAVTQDGAKAVDDWVKFVCPSRPEYRQERVEELGRLIRELEPEGVSLDFIRHFVFWEMVYPERTLESLPQSCFCPHCLAEFEKTAGLVLPAELGQTRDKAAWIIKNHLAEWTEWKCGLIAEMVQALSREAKSASPAVKVNIHLVPWRPGDFDGALRTIAGQDLARLAPLVDYLSPMCYHHMVKRDPPWVHDVVQEYDRLTKAVVLPSIQVGEAYIEARLEPGEFRQALVEALKPPSRGVVFWNWNALAKSPEKKEIVRTVVKDCLEP